MAAASTDKAERRVSEDSPEDQLQDAYLSELLSYSLERLNKEPELLKADADRVRRQMQEVAVGHYRAFITTAEAVQSIRKEVAAIDDHLQNLISEVPDLAKGCSDFLEEATLILEKRSKNKSLLNHHPTLVDLLEIPQLMDTCVRNGNYDEALDLDAFVAKLATMHSKIPIVQSLAREVRAITESMLRQLLSRLRSNIQLPECLRVIAFLRRLSVFSETDMRLQFLRCREAWLSSTLSSLLPSPAAHSQAAAGAGPYEHLKRLTDLYRVHLFDVITQYRAIFLDALEPVSANGMAPAGSRGGSFGHGESAGDVRGDFGISGGDLGGDAGGVLLYSWANHRLGKYLAELSSLLPLIRDGGALASVMDHAMYCGMSLGRVGLDFRGLLPPLFEACIRDIFVANIETAVLSFQHVLDTHRWVPLPPLVAPARPQADKSKGDDMAPPYSLMEHPPLATLVNGILAALNQLRPCAPAPLLPPLSQRLQAALASASQTLTAFHQTRGLGGSTAAGSSSSADSSQALPLFLSMCRAYSDVACPYLLLCFSKCFFPSGGVNTGLVDLRSVTEPVRKLLIANVTAAGDAPAEIGPPDGQGAGQEEEVVRANGEEAESERSSAGDPN